MRWLRRLLALIVVLAIALALGAWLVLRASLPMLDGNVSEASLGAPVTIDRDALGTVTVSGQDRADVTWALGFVHAQERYFEMDLMRRSAAGELAELFGKVALPADRKARVHRLRARAEAALALAPPEQRAVIDRYRDGVNAGLAALSARPFAYLLTRNKPVPWRSEDTILVVDAMYFALNDASNRRELAFSTMHAALPEPAWRFLTAIGGSWDAPLTGPPMRWPDPPGIADIDLRAFDPSLLRGTEAPTSIIPGSNSFAAGGAVTGGAAIVANDMHLELRVPNIWFRARLVYPNPRRAGETVDVSGASLPGTPAIVAGSNRRIAWAFTNSYGDFTDWVRVRTDEADAAKYLTADGSEAISLIEESIAVHGGEPERLSVRETRWGPITAKDVDGSELALAWTAHREGAVNLELMNLERAETVDEGVAIAQRAGMPAQNFVVGDRNGNIAWTIAGRIPKREGGYDPRLPADWSQPGTGWNGWVDPDDYPLLSNPPRHRLWTANARLLDEGPLLDAFGDGGYDLGARQRQIRDGLLMRERIGIDDMLAIQLDDRAMFLERWQALLALTLGNDTLPAQREALRAGLGDWDRSASTGSVSYRIVRAWRSEVIATVLDGFAAAVRAQHDDFNLPRLSQAEHAVWMLIERRPPHLLPPGYEDWNALLLACADRVAERLDQQAGGIAARSWGERNTARIAHPLSRALPGFIARHLDMPAEPLPGDANMPRVQAPGFGASERFAVAPGDEANGYFEMPGGQSGHPLSPFYGAGHAAWVKGEKTPFLPGPARHSLRFTP
ncbi:MAG TPA: penicillin acylase family protein [Dokdonella sp.]|uniref:penicillin acylase family protein n=1 Tax=Dokdonella sp. TaxID=2291710 RepID=UPI0025B8B7C9|nr:penicillin acylase family protein [Dokdonella sp.]MBX3692934.1 penicillin acylase family protein [Dokdonella sp.]MCW5568968.1 penicillin acylase family protein [Dokdonella sp.]HNR92352.1 penicillin acylase family protein [Dokdonella sp.]